MPARESQELLSLRGVGPALQAKLGKLGISNVADILFHLPLRYEDRATLYPLGELQAGKRVLVQGQIEHAAIVPGRRRMLVVLISDGTGRLTLRFFHYRYSQYLQFKKSGRMQCYGEVRAGYQGLEMIHPSYQLLKTGQEPGGGDGLTPVYPTAEGLNQAQWKNLTRQALELLAAGKVALQELLPDPLLSQLNLPALPQALRFIHRPPADADTNALEQRQHPAQQRLALEELLAHNLSMQRLQRQNRSRRAPAMNPCPELKRDFLAQLPFQLTGAQQRVTGEIHTDMGQDHPMQRLLQGDVGSGKTVVAALATLWAYGNGWQTVITAPTELLAEQHLKSFSHWLESLGLEPVWLSGKVTGKAREKALSAIADGAAVVIGTHALMQEGVEFRRLGLVIVDEQHRFGVHQRYALREKGSRANLTPHQLIMTATPIPRTLAMTAYAGLDTSVIDELPPGRKPVTTVAISMERRKEIIHRVAQACSQGRQAYWVCTLIEESDLLEAQAAEATAEQLQDELPQLNIGLVHGRLKAKVKQTVMEQFKQGGIDLLIATTVIEVGVDVPNASLMIIENAERLGLAQLHQLRGRVGRGAKQSSCVLVYKPPLGSTARQRLQIMRETNDGFVIAEKDLELRGPGEVLGTRQTGDMQFRIADLRRDQKLLARIPRIAEQLQRQQPALVEQLIRRWLGEARQYADV